MNKGSWGKVRAFFDLTTDEGFIIKGFRLVEGINGLFVSMPSQKGQDGEYYDTVLADRVLRDKISQKAIQEYGQEIMEPQPIIENNEVSNGSIENNQESNIPEAMKPPTSEPFSDDDIPF
tara:strand:+ start:6068 stop:6427 length:360 start_codon:yes stop_codon:yes gene_type:complete